MVRSLWLRSLVKIARSRNDRRRQAKRSRKSVRLNLEALEDRLTPSFVPLYSFTGGSDGSTPQSGVIEDGSGNFYGTTQTGGSGAGTLYEFSSTGVLTPLHNFDGGSTASLLMDKSGNLFGTTNAGGANNQGTVFELSADHNTYTVLHDFAGSDGSDPEASLVMDSNGDLFGTTNGGGGTGFSGTVFELSPDGSGGYNFQTLHAFSGSDGTNPISGLLLDSSGNLYGTTSQGTSNGFGTVYELSPAGSGTYNFTVLHTFTGGSDGKQPVGGLSMDSSGNLYGTTSVGNTVFELNPTTQSLTTLFTFDSSDGGLPQGNLLLDANDNIYGTTTQGGASNDGTVFQLSPDGNGGYNITDLYNFSGSDGSQPFAGLVADGNGNVYGTTLAGGTDGDGTIFELTNVITSAPTTTTAGNATIPFNESAQNVTLTAEVSSPAGPVNEGTVSFTILEDKIVVGTPTTSGTVSNGAASVSYALPANLVPGSYTIDAVYNPGPDFSGSSDETHTLSTTPAKVKTVAANASAAFSNHAQNVTLNANLSSLAGPVNEGYVTFTILQGSTVIGTATTSGPISNGQASATYALPPDLAEGNYTIEVGYSDFQGNFTDGGDTYATLTIASAVATTSAGNASTTFSTSAQNVTLTANLSSSAGLVNEGTVTFTLVQGGEIIGTPTTSDTVSNGTASVSYALPANLAAGSYTIDAVYNPGPDFSGSSDSTHTLTVAPATVTTTAIHSAAIFSTSAQNVTLTANLSSLAGTIDEGAVTFTILQGSAVIGKATTSGTISNGKASVAYALPAGLAAGSYTIAVSYGDKQGNLVDAGDIKTSLTIAPALVAAIALNATAVLPSAHSVTLNANVGNTSIPGDNVDEGTVTFTVTSGQTVVGTPAEGKVSGGAASASFNLPTGLVPGSYTIAVKYSDTQGNFTDNSDTNATLTVLLLPSVTTNPSDQAVPVGGTAVFTASTHGDPTPTVQWQVSTDGGKTFGAIGDISGASSPTLTLANVQEYQNGYVYQAVFTNSVGTVTTSTATLTVLYAPTVTIPLSAQTVTAGQSATFTVAVNGSPMPTVQWQISSDGGKTFSDISGATSTTLTLDNVLTSQNGYEYQAVITNGIGSVTTAASTLTVQSAPTVTANPTSQTATTNQKVTFTASAVGNPAPTVQWQVSTDGGQTFSDISGAISPTLTLLDVTGAQNGNEYQAVFTNSIGSATTSAATLTVNNATLPVVTGNPSSQTVSPGANVSFTASAGGSPAPTVQWQVSSDGGKTFTNIPGATSTTLTLNDVTAAMNDYEFQAVFSDAAGTAASYLVTLAVNALLASSPATGLNVPPLLVLLDALLGAIETVNANGTETIEASLFGIPLVESTYNTSGKLVSATFLGVNITDWVWIL